MAATDTLRRVTGRPRKSRSRAFRLRAGQPVGEEIERIARGRIAHALDQLEGRTSSTPEVAVHEARKDLKKLRGVLRLVRGEMTGGTFRRENAALRDIGRSLSGVRDADVMLDTLGGLESRFPETLPADVAGGLRQALEAHRRSLRAAPSEAAVPALIAARERVSTWAPQRDGFDVIGPGLERSYRRARRAFRTAHSDPSAENLHEWRKRAKDHWYHLTILRDVWPPAIEPLAEAAHELSDRLGEEHDLQVLLDFAWERGPDLDGVDRVSALVAVIAPCREELRAEAYAIGERLYSEKPRAFARRVEGLWRAWRKLEQPVRA
jgi:CHAD domain-containing protein